MMYQNLTELKPEHGKFRVASLDFYGTWSWVDALNEDDARKAIRAIRNGAEKIFVFDVRGACVYQA